ncbi:MAG: HPr family phosphocarrier protein [Planctomycetaceae bacterium]|nr:HPr family phosphocarrier protein [Planctomycetaceae bacterium]
MMSESISERIVTVRNSQGLHMRPADLLVKAAMKFRCRIELEKDGQIVDARSILGLLTLGAQAGTSLNLKAIGDDAPAAIQALGDLFDNCFYETDGQAEAAI